jgi:FkbM family methyltransferase
MSKLGPYASYSKETGYATWDHPTAEYVGIFERLNVDIKGIIHVGMWDFVEYHCYTKLVGSNVIGVEANKFVYETMSKPVADRHGYKSFNECVYSEDGLEKQFYLSNDCSSLSPVSNNSVTVTTKKLSTIIEENHIDMNQYDFLNIDAEGAELEILKGFEDNLKYINVIDLETSYDDRNNTGAFHSTIVDWLSKRNFSLMEMSDSYRYERWGDSVFVRNDRKLPPYNNDKYLLK